MKNNATFNRINKSHTMNAETVAAVARMPIEMDLKRLQYAHHTRSKQKMMND